MPLLPRVGPTAGLALALIAGPANAEPRAQQAPAAEASGPRPAQIDRNGVLILIRSTLLALNQANETGNYTVLRDLAAPGFAAANTAARLGEIFASQRAQRLDLSGVAVLDPQLTLLPQIEANGMMRMAGFFPSAPSQVNFELLFAAVDGRWRAFGVAVNIGSSTPSAPTSAQPLAIPRSTSAAGPKPDGKTPQKTVPHAPQHHSDRAVQTRNPSADAVSGSQ